MEDFDLPHRLIAAGEEPLGERVNVYNKMKTLNGIIDSLDATEINLIRDSPLGGLLDFPNKPAWSASFGLYLLGRQLDIAKANEIWVVYAGTPVRFFLREFHLVTGLACGRYPDVPKKKRKGTAGKEIPFYSTLFGLESDVTVERVITMLKKKVTNDPSLRIRYAVLALVDGYLLPTSHHPKIIKEHAEMSENLTFFLTYPWGRLTFEMMMNSIKERELEQLATTSVAVQGLLYALQLVVLQAAPAIQEGPVSEETVGSESDEDTIELHPRQVVPFKLGNAKVLDTKCQTHVDPIIHPGVLLDPAEDVSWSDDEVDPRVDTMVKLAEEGFKFNNDIFPGGCIPSEVVVAPKKQKRSATLKGGRVRKSSKQGRIPKNPTGIRRTKQTVQNVEESVVLVDMNALSRMLDGKLNAQYKKILKGVTDWFIANTLISAENGKDVPAENGKEVPADKGKGKKVTVPQSNPLHLSDGDDDFDTLFPLRPPSRRSSRIGKAAHRAPQVPGEGLGLDNSVEGIASYYNGLSPGDCSGSRAVDGIANHVDDDENGLGICQSLKEGSKAFNADGNNGNTAVTINDNNLKGDEENRDLEDNTAAVGNPQGDEEIRDLEDNTAAVGNPQTTQEVDSESATDVSSEESPIPDASPKHGKPIQDSQIEDTGDEVLPSGDAPPNDRESIVEKQSSGDAIPKDRESIQDSQTERDEEGDEEDSQTEGDNEGDEEDSQTEGDDEGDEEELARGDASPKDRELMQGVGSKYIAPKDCEPIRGTPNVSSPEMAIDSLQDPPVLLVAPISVCQSNKVLVPEKGDVPSQTSVVGNNGGRRSKRLRTRSTKLDGRFQFDKKTKLLVGHPSPIANTSGCLDPEERFNRSLKKLKAISSISLGPDVSVSSKDVLELIERKKPLAIKVMDALLKFSRHILRTDEVDGEKLRVDVLDTKFISQLCRLYPKFSKAPVSQDFQFPTALVDAVCGVGELDRAELFTEVDYLYLPFNFDKKHWVALCVDLNCAKITVLDSNVHLRTDASIKVDIEPLSKMLPILFRQAASNPIMSQLLPTPFSVERSLCIPQVTSHVDAGLMTIFLIHAHAAGGMDACAEFLPECIEAETKKLVSAIILAGVP
ncbi:Ulp1 protease family C-terminal catalytic domain [Arabidopsis thaliana x Arabidopsis arenosa]|uniref:Ulp1 protease family C-terminal catalytic domain n=1 Tax=Arabidopsis thaliana x Arabidopsis arenosa TaxID=1240361 RepID=A0A8T1Z210_9BRAS|nr:Ulp1 protease family C-terminal catalytic domain [Arabidopsis thaliana x Arabidopsis arenosa]